MSRSHRRWLSLPSPTTQTLAWTGAAVATAVAVLPEASMAAAGPRGRLLALVLVTVVAGLTRLQPLLSMQRRDVQEHVSFEEAALVVLLVVLPPDAAWLVFVTGFAATRLVLRRSPGIKVLFNISLWTVTVWAACAVFDALAPSAPEVLDLQVVVALTAAVAVHAVLNWVGVGLVLRAATGLSFRGRLHATWHLGLLAMLGNLLLGLAAAALWLQAPWVVAAALGLALVLRGAYRTVVAAEEAADELRIDRDRLDQVIGDTPAGMVLVDHAGTVTVWNRAMERLTGTAAAAAVGAPLDEVLADRLHRPDSDEELSLDELLAPLPGGEDAVVVRHTGGEDRLATVLHRAQEDRAGATAGTLVQFQDVTTEREAARLKDDFLARVTHELRTPLTSILGFGRTLRDRDGALSTDVRETMTTQLVAAGEHLERLVDDLLLVAGDGADPSSRTRAMQRVQLEPVLSAAIELERAEHPGRLVEVRRLADPEAVLEPAWLTTTVRHLVCNALTYSAHPAPVVVELDADDQHAVVRVVDRGRGIPPSKLHRVFDRFTRVEDPLLMETRGAGLGLFIVQRLVTRMGGQVEVDSTLGEGSTFLVRLPSATPERSAPSRSVRALTG